MSLTHMVEVHLGGRGITDPRVLEAFRTVPREAFVDPALRPFAFDDQPLPIGEGQTVSQPSIVAFTAQALALTGSERLLEVGTGSGYAAAIFSHLAKTIFTIERSPTLPARARLTLAAAGYGAIEVRDGDGSLGWPDAAPFDAIAVAAASPEVPASLQHQLSVGGRLVVPVGRKDTQALVRVTRRSETEWSREDLLAVRFVPLVGAEGWP